jgi:hypothetical protein
MNKFDAIIKELALHVRDRLKVSEDISRIQFSIDISGRAHDGDLNIKYEVGSTYQDGGVVKGPKLEIVLDEYLRRFGWDQQNQPLCISFTGEEVPNVD